MIRVPAVVARRTILFTIGAAVALTAGSAEARKKKAPPPPPPPPPPMIVLPPPPPRPAPPYGASANLPVPAIGPDGVFESVNRKITPAQTVWNFRSAYNVAALNCRDPKYDPMVVGYRAFLKKHARFLALTNRKVDAEFRKGLWRPVHPRARKVHDRGLQPLRRAAHAAGVLRRCDGSQQGRARGEADRGDRVRHAQPSQHRDRVRPVLARLQQVQGGSRRWDAKYASPPVTVAATTATVPATPGTAATVPTRSGQ